jgi:hypothetical protein
LLIEFPHSQLIVGAGGFVLYNIVLIVGVKFLTSQAKKEFKR